VDGTVAGGMELQLAGGDAWHRLQRFVGPTAGGEGDRAEEHHQQDDEGGQGEFDDGDDAGGPGLLQAGEPLP
jgi:hypothetical protein